MKRLFQNMDRYTLSTDSTRSASKIFAPTGGIALRRNKTGLPEIGGPIREIALPAQLTLPLLDYAKQAVKPSACIGADVRPGDTLAPGILAPCFGVVSAIEPRAIIHPSQKPAMCIVIDVDQNQQRHHQSLPKLRTLTRQRLADAGICGLGGAGFSTTHKFTAALQGGQTIDTLVINAVECEPFISCDEALIRSDASAIVMAIHAMIQLTACQRCILAIEDDKTDAINELEQHIQALESSTAGTAIELATISAIYPSGAEKVLIQRLTGNLYEAPQRASDKGILCLNVATVFAAWQSQQGHPLLSRIVTVAGDGAQHHTNVRVYFGTSVSHVLQHTDNMPDSKNVSIRAGGPLSGFEIADLSAAVTATSNCITVEPAADSRTAEPCIRCGYCIDACPVNLLPQQLLWYARSDDIPGAVHFGLDNCIECGCCDLVCPSAIKLTETFRSARSTRQEQQHQKKSAELAKTRFEQHEIRISQRADEERRLREQKKSTLASDDDAIARALARSRARKKKH